MTTAKVKSVLSRWSWKWDSSLTQQNKEEASPWCFDLCQIIVFSAFLMRNKALLHLFLDKTRFFVPATIRFQFGELVLCMWDGSKAKSLVWMTIYPSEKSQCWGTLFLPKKSGRKAFDIVKTPTTRVLLFRSHTGWQSAPRQHFLVLNLFPNDNCLQCLHHKLFLSSFVHPLIFSKKVEQQKWRSWLIWFCTWHRQKLGRY